MMSNRPAAIRRLKLEDPFRLTSNGCAYGDARREHAWLLRAEGETFRSIGQRLGVNSNRARQLVWIFGRRAQKSIDCHQTKLYWHV